MYSTYKSQSVLQENTSKLEHIKEYIRIHELRET